MTSTNNPAPATIEPLLAALEAEARHLTPAQIAQLINTLRRTRDPHAPLMGVPGSVVLAALPHFKIDDDLFQALLDAHADCARIDYDEWQ